MMPHIFVIYMYLVVRWRGTITVGLSKCKLIRQDVYRFIIWLKNPIFWIRASLTDIHYSCRSVRSSRSEWKLWMGDFFQTGGHWPVYLLVSLLQVYKLVNAKMILKGFYSNKFILIMDECTTIALGQKLQITKFILRRWWLVRRVCVCVYTLYLYTHTDRTVPLPVRLG